MTVKEAAARNPLSGLPRLVHHRHIAAQIGVTAECIRRWVARGEWPRPHSTRGSLLFYKVADVAAYLESGAWPPS